MTEDFDVAIVGLGPVGATLANLLGQSGIRTLVLEREHAHYHLPRAVTLCRQMGIDATGVGARCDGCDLATLGFNALRDYLASSKAALDVLRGRPPAVRSRPSDAIGQALAAA